MRTVLVGLALLVVVPSLDAVPAAAPARLPKQKLEALKKKLPGVLEAWLKNRRPYTFAAVLRRVRVLGASEAKVVIHVHDFDGNGKVEELPALILTVYLSYYDGLWTATRFQWSEPDISSGMTKAAHFLMDAIDEAAEKL